MGSWEHLKCWHLELGTYASTKFQTLIKKWLFLAMFKCFLLTYVTRFKNCKRPCWTRPCDKGCIKKHPTWTNSSNQQRIHRVHFGGSGATLQNYAFLPRTTPWIPEPWTNGKEVTSKWLGWKAIGYGENKIYLRFLESLVGIDVKYEHELAVHIWRFFLEKDVTSRWKWRWWTVSVKCSSIPVLFNKSFIK